MRHLVKITLLIIIMTLTTATASADKYSRAWKKVEQLIKDDLPESAVKEINSIWDMAAKDGDGRQLLKSAVYLTRVQQAYGENSIKGGIDLFNSLLPTLKVQEHKALCHAFLAKGYMHYWEMNRYNVSKRIPTDEENPPLEHWTPRMICDTICYHLNQSILLAGDVASGYYQDFFPGGNKAGQKLRPMLVDMMMDNAVVLVTDYRFTLAKRKFFDDARLYGTMGDFLEATRELTPEDPDLWQFYVLRQLTNHNFASKPDIRCTIDIRRMQVLNSYLENMDGWNKNDEEWLKGAVALAQTYSRKVKFSTMFYSMAARKIVDRVEDLKEDKAASLMRQAHDICIAAQKKWPKSEGALECMVIRDEIERKSVNLEFQSDFVPGERNIAKLLYTNVSTVYLKVVEVPSRFNSTTDEITLLSQLNQSNTVAEWSMRVNDPADFLEHNTLINIPPVMQGSYYLMASSGQSFSPGDCISYQYVECNGIMLLKMVQNNGTLVGTAVDTRTGKPVPDCKYTVWKINYNDEQTRVMTSGITESDGNIVIEGLKNDRYSIELESAGSKGNSIFSIPWQSDMPDRDYIRLFTDRYTYLPGDSVHFTGVIYNKGTEKGGIKAGVHVLMSATDYQTDVIIDSLVSDSMGVFKGSYRIPENQRPGRLVLRAEYADDGDPYAAIGGQTPVNVESFRQPKFEVKMDPCTEEVRYDVPVTITGRAVSFTGVPLEGAAVSWYAGVNPMSCHRFCIPDKSGSVRVGAGDIITGPDGSFSFCITVPSEMMLDNHVYVRVETVVTDVNGETHDGNTFFNAVQKPDRFIMVYTRNDVIGSNGDKTLRFDLNSSNGALSGPIDVKVVRLDWPEQPGLKLPFSVRLGIKEEKDRKELSQCADNLNLKERFPHYDFDFNGNDAMETVVFDGTVLYDKDDPESAELNLKGLRSGVYRVIANAQGCKEFKQEYTFCRVDDFDFVPLKPLLWGYNLETGASNLITANPGETVKIRLGNSRKGSIIHYIIENRYGVYERGMMESNGRQQILSIPVTEELIGMFSVHCSVLYEGVSENISFQFEVPDIPRKLNFEFITFRNVLEPDTEEEWQIRITDWRNNPVKAAIIMDMYDRALDTYGLNNISFNPFSAVWVGSRDLLYRSMEFANQYWPWLYSFGNNYEYKGKRAVTGTLLDPYSYRSMSLISDLRKVRSYSAASARLTGIDNDVEESAILLKEPSPQVEESLQGRAGGLDVVFNSAVLADELPDNAAQDQKGIALRTDLNPTGLFEYLVTDSDGLAKVRFRAPQLLTEWRVQGITFTDSLKTGRIDTTLITRKKIMVEPASPRFLRESDRMEFTVKVSNLTGQAFKADVIMTFTDAQTGKLLNIVEGGYKKSITIPAGGSTGTSFTVCVPAGLKALTYRLSAQTSGHSDGIQETIPVLSNRTQVVQALSLFNNGNEKRTFRFEVLDKPRSATMADEELTLEYSATPIWYAIQSLPVLIKTDDPSNLRLFHSMMGAAISQDLVRRYPAIRQMLDEWAALPVSEWQTQLERNQKLTGTLLEETPWLRCSNNERDRLHALATQLGTEETAQAFETALQKILDAQNDDGSWSWIAGCPANMHITDEIMQGLGLMIENGIIDVTPELKTVIQRGLDYLDGYFYKEYKAPQKPESLGYSELSYLLTRSYYSSYPFSDLTIASHTYFNRLAEIEDTHDLNIYFRTGLALLMARNGMKDRAEHIAATLLERSLYTDEMGRYWRDNAGGLMWHEAPIETQALIIRTLLAVDRKAEAAEAARWLLKQKQTTGWGSSPATAAAVVALMATGADAQLESDPDITIYVGKDAVRASDRKANAGYTTHTWQGPIGRDKATVTIDSKSEGISWGAVYRSFTEELDKVEHNENGMSLKRTIWRVIHGADGDRLEEVKPGTVLKVGDRLKIRFELTADRNLEYLQLADMRAATVEPVSTHAGYSYNWRDDIGYYTAPGNTRNVFYIDRLNKGSYVIEYEVNVQKPGRFTVGVAVMQCLYAPAFRATTTSAVLTVE